MERCRAELPEEVEAEITEEERGVEMERCRAELPEEIEAELTEEERIGSRNKKTKTAKPQQKRNENKTATERKTQEAEQNNGGIAGTPPGGMSKN
jgi:hypothetical protein